MGKTCGNFCLTSTESKPRKKQKRSEMGGSCKDQRLAVAVCLQRSPCVLIDRHTPTECIENPELTKDLPELCKAQMKAFWECKKGFFDMSKRFRGNAPLSTGKYDQQFENLSSGNFNAVEEYKKLQILDSQSKE